MMAVLENNAIEQEEVFQDPHKASNSLDTVNITRHNWGPPNQRVHSFHLRKRGLLGSVQSGSQSQLTVQ